MDDAGVLAVARTLRVPFSAGVCLLGAAVVAGIGRPLIAVGVAAGIALALLNLVLLYASGRSALGLDSARAARLAAVTSSVGRLLLVGVGLALVSLLGHAPLLAACGALLFIQLVLHVAARRQTRRSVACSERSSHSSGKP